MLKFYTACLCSSKTFVSDWAMYAGPMTIGRRVGRAVERSTRRGETRDINGAEDTAISTDAKSSRLEMGCGTMVVVGGKERCPDFGLEHNAALVSGHMTARSSLCDILTHVATTTPSNTTISLSASKSPASRTSSSSTSAHVFE